MANFGSGSVSVIRLKEDDSLGELTSFIQNIGHSVNPAIQTAPHPHSILVSPDNRYVIVSDLGLDKILIFHFDEKTGELSPPDPPFATVKPGGGPRHFAFSPSGKFAYQLSEMSGIVDAFAWDPAAGTLTNLQSSETIPHDFTGENHSAEIAVSPGRQISLRIESSQYGRYRMGSRYHRHIRHRSGQGHSDPGGADAQRSNYAAQLCHRSYRLLPVGGSPVFEQRDCVQDRSRDRPPVEDRSTRSSWMSRSASSLFPFTRRFTFRTISLVPPGEQA